MRPFVLLPTMALLTFLISCSDGNNELARMGLKGQVKSVKEQQCDPTYEDDMWVSSDNCTGGYRLLNFDPEGYYENIINFDRRHDTVGMAKVRYEDGELVEEVYYQRMPLTPKHSKLVPGSRTVMDRVSADQVNFEVWQSDALVFEGATYYDSKGRIERQVQVIQNREVMVHHVYEKDLLVENYQIELDGSRSATQLYDYVEFDEFGNWTVQLIYLGEEKISPEIAVTRSYEYY